MSSLCFLWLSADQCEEAAADRSAAYQRAELVQDSRALQPLPHFKGSNAVPIWLFNIFCASGKNTKCHRWLLQCVAGGSIALWLWQWPSFCRTQRTWISSWSLLTNGKSSWLLSCPSWRRLSMLSANSSVPSTRALSSGSTSAPHRISKDKLRYERRSFNV